MLTTGLRALSALLCVLILTACVTAPSPPSGQIRTVLLYPPIPYEKLTCPLEPPVPDSNISQELFGVYTEQVRKAGEDCRKQLDFWRAYILTWESKVDQSDIWVEEGDDF